VFKKIFVIPKVGGANVQRSHDVIKSMHRVLMENYDSLCDLQIIDSIADIDENTVAVPVGGDGTVLYAAKMLAELNIDIPIIGFNLGQLGFLTDMLPTTIAIWELFDTILDYEDSPNNKGPFTEDHRTMLSFTDADGNTSIALNDFVISNQYSDSIVKYDLGIGESFAGTHKANGVIVCTPTGSTAYAMNVGGSIIEPDLDVMQIVAVAGMGMSNRPIIVKGSDVITISVKGVEGRTVSLKADGIERQLYVDTDATIKIVRHEKKVRLLHMAGWNYFDKLRQKMNWNV
jgi:NAD+ kinase